MPFQVKNSIFFSPKVKKNTAENLEYDSSSEIKF